MAARKLRIDPIVDGNHHRGRWNEAVAKLARDLHSADGTRFVPCVGALAASGTILEEPWVGVVHTDAGAPDTDPQIEQLRELDSFRANLRACQGLWGLSSAVTNRLREWQLPVPVAQVHDVDQDPGFEGFTVNVANNAIYRSLPTPPNEAGEFRPFDLTVMMCSYKRVHNIGPILASLCEQTYSGSFEVIIWNNNIDATEELERAVAPFRSKLDLTMIHSSRNYYCIVRLAVAHLMRSELLMICDDDVRPAPEYLETFVAGLREAGDRAVVCARGNAFRPHRLNPSTPESVWERWEHLDFWDVDAPPREIHFMHGSNCLLPRAALLELSALDLPRREFILVDDYWLSYALSGKLGWKLWKIQATNAFQFDKSAEDPEVALFLNSRVRDQRTDFYVYHMSQGWPEGCGV